MKDYRYILQPYKGMKTRHACPACNKPKIFVRYIDKETGQPLPYQYGKCERLNKCGYHINPYSDGYWKSIKDQEKTNVSTSKVFKRRKASSLPLQVGSAKQAFIPLPFLKKSLKLYFSNSFVSFLAHHLGHRHTENLVKRFFIGTSKYWDGATVFWLINEKMKIVGGQVILFDENGNTVKEKRSDSSIKRYNSWVHIALRSNYQKQGKRLPSWLKNYIDNSPKFPCLFGLHQLNGSDANKPVAIVEAAKTAIIASAYLPQFIWMASGSLTYLNEDRLSPLRGRKTTLFPDKGGYERWNAVAQKLSHLANINVSNLLEIENVAHGSDLADYLTNFDPKEFRTSGSNKPLVCLHTKNMPEDRPIISKVEEFTSYNGRRLRIVLNEYGYPANWD